MTAMERAEAKRARRAARGPGFSRYARWNVSDEAAQGRKRYGHGMGARATLQRAAARQGWSLAKMVRAIVAAAQKRAREQAK